MWGETQQVLCLMPTGGNYIFIAFHLTQSWQTCQNKVQNDPENRVSTDSEYKMQRHTFIAEHFMRYREKNKNEIQHHYYCNDASFAFKHNTHFP